MKAVEKERKTMQGRLRSLVGLYHASVEVHRSLWVEAEEESRLEDARKLKAQWATIKRVSSDLDAVAEDVDSLRGDAREWALQVLAAEYDGLMRTRCERLLLAALHGREAHCSVYSAIIDVLERVPEEIRWVLGEPSAWELEEAKCWAGDFEGDLAVQQ